MFFEQVDANFHKNAAEVRDDARDGFIVAGQSYGQGSSREHAAMCPMYLGVKSVLAQSFERIHAANLVNFGILPLIFDKIGDYDGLDKNDQLIIGDIFTALEKNIPVIVKIQQKALNLQ